MTRYHQSQSAYVAEKIAAAERALKAHVVSLVDAGDVESLSTAANFPIGCRILLARLPTARGLSAIGASPIGILFAAGVSLPLRVAQTFGLIRADASATSVGKTLRLIRAAKGPAGETVRALLTGKGEPVAAVLLRKIIEARRGYPLPVVDIEGGST